MKVVSLTPTYAVIYLFTNTLHLRNPERHFLALLNNLFVNLAFIHCLLNVNVAVIDIIRKNAKGMTQALLDAKTANRSLV
jgi:multisubunit Na+/H+ antiporter MnhE subunit